MECPTCKTPAPKFGKTKDGRQRYRCRTCKRVLTTPKEKPAVEIRIPRERVILILTLLCEGNSIRSIERITGTEKRTILRLLTLLGPRCEKLLAELVKDVEVEDVEADELWTYVYCKQGTKERKKIKNSEAGDAYCFVGLERHSKLILAWHVGSRTSQHADLFCEKLAEATTGKFQLSSDGWNGYPNAVDYNLGDRVDYAQQVKEFASPGGEEARRYGPPRLIGSEKISVIGKPEEERIGTSRVERSNWTIRTHLRRFTRLSNGFSRRRRNLRCAFAIYAAYYNLVKSHASIRMPPAVKAGVTRKPWTVGDLLDAVAV